MSNTTLEQLIATKMLEIMSQEQKDRIVHDYIQTNVFGSYFDSMVRDPARTVLSEMMRKEIQTQINDNSVIIKKAVEDSVNAFLADKNILSKLIEQEYIRKTAKIILNK